MSVVVSKIFNKTNILFYSTYSFPLYAATAHYLLYMF